MRKILLFALTLHVTVAFAQPSDSRALKSKAAVLKAMGGEKAVKGIRHFSYTIHRAAYGGDTSLTRTNYTIDLTRQLILEKQYTASDSVVSWIGEDGAWLWKGGNKTALPEADAQRLQRTFLTNFIPMLQNDTLVYEFKERSKYKGRKVDIVQVFTPQKKTLILDLFVDSKSGRILTSSRPDAETGKYTYFADELDYQPIGEGVIFPLTYQIWRNEKLLAEGKFENVVVKK